MREQSFLQDGSDGYAIYQLSDKPENHYLRFARLSELDSLVQKDNYDLVYTGVLKHSQLEKPAAILEELFRRFNLDRPDDFHGHSLSVSDVIVLKLDHEIKSYYTESSGKLQLKLCYSHRCCYGSSFGNVSINASKYCCFESQKRI